MRPYIAFILLATFVSVLGIVWTFPAPSVDDPAIKSPAAELIQNGKLALPSMRGRLPGVDLVHASYPPGYPLVISAWFWIWGVSLRSSLAFSYLIHAIQSLFLMAMTRRFLRTTNGTALNPVASLATNENRETWLSLAIGLIHFSNLTLLDRMEDLAILFTWCTLLTFEGLARQATLVVNTKRSLGFVREGFLKAVVLGLLWGCVAVVSPFICLLTSSVIGVRTLLMIGTAPRGERLRMTATVVAQLGLAAVVVTLMLGGWVLWIETMLPGSFTTQFLGHMKELKQTQVRGDSLFQLQLFIESLSLSPGQFPAMLLGLICLIGLLIEFLRKGLSSQQPAMVTSLAAATSVWLPLLAWTRPDSTPYIIGLWTMFLPCCGWSIGNLMRKAESDPQPWISPRWLTACVLICVAFTLRETITIGYRAWSLAPEEKSQPAFARLHATIPAGDRVAVMSRYWNAFQGRNPWLDPYFSSRSTSAEVEKCDWLVLVPGIGEPDFIEHFEFVERVGAAPPQHPTYGYCLYRRKTEFATAAD